MKKKSMTIDDLAVMVQKGFDESNTRMDRMDQRLDHMDQQIGHMDERISHMEEQITHELKAIRKDLLGVVYRPEFGDLEERVKDLENLLAMPSKRTA